MNRILIFAVSLLFALSSSAQMLTDSVYVNPPKHLNWGRAATTVGLTFGMRFAIVPLIKNGVGELRPDGSDYKSFPSRHSTWAYGIAGTITYHAGSRSPWWGVGSQTVANAIAFQRVMARRHYPGDIYAGAGIGIVTDVISELVADAIFGYKNEFAGWRYADNNFSSSLSSSTGAAFPLSAHYGDIEIGTALATTIRGVVPANEWAGISFSASLLTAPVKADGQSTCMRPLSSIRIGLGPRMHWRIADGLFAVGCGAEGGYQANIKVRGYDVNSGSAFICVDLNASVMLTNRLAIGLEGGISACKLSLNNVSKKLAIPQVAIFTRANF